MNKLTIAKFGGSAIGIDGEGIPEIVRRIKEIQKNSKLVVVCSAPLTMVDEKKRSLTDVILGIGKECLGKVPFMTLSGRRGGSAMAAAAINALPKLR